MTRTLVALLAVSLLMGGGCMKIHTDTTIEKDGSGTATLYFSMAKEVAEAMEELSDMPNSQMDEAPPSPTAITKDEVEKAAAQYGVKVKKFEKFTDADRDGFEMELAFEHLQDLSYVLAGVMGGGEDALCLFSTGDGNFLLTSTKLDLPDEPDEEFEVEAEADAAASPDDMSQEDMQKSMAVMQKMMAHMSDLDILMKITVPGDVIESNAPQVDGRTSIWKVDSSNMMEQQGELEPMITFSGKGVKIKAPLKTE